MKRRLAAIIAADVVGYSRMIRADEDGTLAALSAMRAEVVDPVTARNHGRIVRLMGDGLLVEFASAGMPFPPPSRGNRPCPTGMATARKRPASPFAQAVVRSGVLTDVNLATPETDQSIHPGSTSRRPAA